MSDCPRDLCDRPCDARSCTCKPCTCSACLAATFAARRIAETAETAARRSPAAARPSLFDQEEAR